MSDKIMALDIWLYLIAVARHRRLAYVIKLRRRINNRIIRCDDCLRAERKKSSTLFKCAEQKSDIKLSTSNSNAWTQTHGEMG
jgi:hypothetical protein